MKLTYSEVIKDNFSQTRNGTLLIDFAKQLRDQAEIETQEREGCVKKYCESVEAWYEGSTDFANLAEAAYIIDSQRSDFEILNPKNLCLGSKLGGLNIEIGAQKEAKAKKRRPSKAESEDIIPLFDLFDDPPIACRLQVYYTDLKQLTWRYDFFDMLTWKRVTSLGELEDTSTVYERLLPFSSDVEAPIETFEPPVPSRKKDKEMEEK